MKIAVIPNLIRSQSQECALEVTSVLKKHGCEIYLKNDLFDNHGYCQSDTDESLSTCDVLIAVGGDGTIIHTAKIAALLEKPILGVNAGNMGFTAGVERTELELLPRLLDGNYRLEKRSLLTVNRMPSGGGAPQELLAMNDAVVTGAMAKIIDYEIAFGKHATYQYRADGFIVATPTGSTAYSLSAGGPIIEPEMDCLVYTPICPHSLFDRSIVLSHKMKLFVEVLNARGPIQLTVDGETPVLVEPGDKLEFRQSQRFAQFIRLNQRDFYDTLNQKIIVGRQ